ncbi:MAG TPA: phage baseplate assembly protein V [Flavobacterium sp.]|uniref:phage baseplate assembly protein V n=1 Tax=Flavobacterium sp. TaxID=239 RepID=UPI002CC0F87B|nr:phage baseplate assembly protein V [Flavobacterium sp.]HSD13893.1 phage baseplate assembly protein V [Flavobacterium sp.]
MVQLQTNGKDANSIFYSGVSYLPLSIGQKFTIKNKTVEHNLLVIEVTHNSEVHGNYNCEFKASPADVTIPHYTDVHAYAKAETQPAKVTDNNDPNGLGRVQVSFNWAGGSTKSDWLRLIQPHAGAGKGFYFIPEIGEEVLVGFEGGNAERPYVMGTNYNGSESSGYADGSNNLKAIHTRSGTKIILNDEEGSVFIEDPSGNTWKMDGKGNINVTATNDIIFTAGKNFNINVGENMTTNIAMNKSDTVGMNTTESTGETKMTIVTGDFLTNVEGSLFELIKGNRESESKERKETAKLVTLDSTEAAINIKSAKNINSHSGEKPKNA